LLTLASRLEAQIQRDGPITFREWMEAALYDPEAGYYAKDRERWGRDGDYRTSPEKTELFAATFARYFAKLYQQLDPPDGWTIVECGGGDGHFAHGVLETLRDQHRQVFDQTTYVFAEFVQTPREKLELFRERVHYVSLNDLSSTPNGVFFSNELLDAFPVHQVIKKEGELKEIYVTLNAAGEFIFTTGPISTPEVVMFCNELPQQLEEGQIIEVNPGIRGWFETVSQKLERGFVISVDYGADESELYSFQTRPQGSLRAYSKHKFVENILSDPGGYDITTSVDWSYVGRVGESVGLKVVQFERQDRFLLEEGLLEELQKRTASSVSEGERAALATGAREMIMPNGMAASFQVLVQEKIS
jgi:SAM-dependent MidA family methyltransferase